MPFRQAMSRCCGSQGMNSSCAIAIEQLARGHFESLSNGHQDAARDVDSVQLVPDDRDTLLASRRRKLFLDEVPLCAVTADMLSHTPVCSSADVIDNNKHMRHSSYRK
jgi:hypothetical protein